MFWLILIVKPMKSLVLYNVWFDVIILLPFLLNHFIFYSWSIILLSFTLHFIIALLRNLLSFKLLVYCWCVILCNNCKWHNIFERCICQIDTIQITLLYLFFALLFRLNTCTLFCTIHVLIHTKNAHTWHNFS